MEWQKIEEIPNKFVEGIDGWNGYQRYPEMVWALPEGRKPPDYCWCDPIYVTNLGITLERICPQPTHYMIVTPPTDG